MKSSRFKYSYRENASKLHQKVGDILRAGRFSNHKIYQEYPVCRVNKDYSNTRHHFDWVVKDLALVIEVHGEGHYNSIRWGGISIEEAEENFIASTIRDRDKKQAALDAGYTYIVVPYWDAKVVNESYLWDLYQENIDDTQIVKPIHKKKEETEYERDVKQKIREDRKKQYKKHKEYIKQKEG